MFGGTSVNALIRGFLDEYAAVPASWREGMPPPWTPEGKIRQVMDPVGAGLRAAERAADEDDALTVGRIQEGPLARQG
jgi:hypothetical protein